MNSFNRLRIPVAKNDHIRGPEKAPLTLVEYGDYECPYCARAHFIVKQLQRAMHHQLRFVYRNFPLAYIHPFAWNAARAAEVAALQGKYWQMYDVLFENQEALDDASLAKYASQMGMAPPDFTREMNNSRIDERISLDLEGGGLSGVEGTPTLFINDLRYEGEMSVDAILQALHETQEERSGRQAQVISL